MPLTPRCLPTAVANEFAVAHGQHYLLSHSVGLLPNQAQTALKAQVLDPWRAGSGSAWSSWMPVLNGFNQALAELLGGNPNEYCPQTNLSSAWTKVLHALPMQRPRAAILLSETDFPTMGFVAQRAHHGAYGVRYLSAKADHCDPQTWADAMTPDVQWVLITHVQSNTGVQVPVADIVRVAREKGVVAVVDVAQSVGVLPIDVASWNAHFVIGSCVKWLCGGPGAGFLWVHPQLVQQCTPQDVGWFSHENPMELNIRHFAYHQSALRFWGGTPSVAPYCLAGASVQYLARLGIQAIRDHNLALTQQIIQAVPPDYLVSPVEPSNRSGTVIVHPQEQLDTWMTTFRARGIHVDARALGIRISPHVYTTQASLEVLLRTIHDLA